MGVGGGGRARVFFVRFGWWRCRAVLFVRLVVVVL